MDCLLIRGYGIDQACVGSVGSLSSKMDDSAAREDACREYQSSLEDLTFNSKPHINMLTILAEENLQFAKDIVAIIEAQISKVDENTRKSLFKLRSTWDEVFPLKKLYALDVRVNSVDPAWPIKSHHASIHVNPRFLKQSEEASSPQPAPAQPPPAAPAPPPAPAISQSSVTQEQLIRQQLLAKQKQLLELQQKKIELELEQTKAQLAGGFVLPTTTAAPTTPSTASKPVSQTAPVVRPWIPPQPQADPKPSTRDPRLNRGGPPAAAQPRDQPAARKETPNTAGGPALTPEKRPMEKFIRPDRTRTARKDLSDEKSKSKSPSPMAKSAPSKSKQAEAETPKALDGVKKDPRLRKRPQDRPPEASANEQKEKKRCSDKKEREAEPLRSNKKLLNGSVAKHDRDDIGSKPDFKTGGNARTHARKRSRSRSRSPAASPKRKDRRSPKSQARSSLSPSPSHKPGKPQRIHGGKPGRDDRLAPKKNQSESRRPKRPAEDRHSPTHPRSHDGGGGKEAKEAPHRWRSGWEENKHLKLPEDSHMKSGPQRHKPYGTPTRPGTPRTPKHRISVDANLQIPEALNSASKKDLLRRASKRLESGEISQEDFLNMAHQIKHFFQYQEEKQQRSESWDAAADFPMKKQLLLGTPPAAQPRPHDGMDAAELSYYEHKSKLRKTQVNHRVTGEEWEGEEPSDDGVKVGPGEKTGGPTPPHKYGRAPRDRQGERRSNEREEAPPAPMIEEYNHGKEFPAFKFLPGLHFRKKAGKSSERERTSPLTERQQHDDREEQRSSYDTPRRYGLPGDPRRQEGPPPPGPVALRNCPSPAGLDAPRFERERLSPLHQKDAADASPVPRFESPNSEHSDDGPLNLDLPHPHPPSKPVLKGPPRGGPLAAVRQHGDSPGHTPPHDGGHPQSRYNNLGPSRPHPPGWYEGGPGRFDEPHLSGPGRFDGGGPSHHSGPERIEGPGQCDPSLMTHGPMRGDGMGRFDGPQGPGRFGGPIGQQAPVRYEGQAGGPAHFEAPGRFSSMAPGPMGFQQQRPLRFDGPVRFDGPGRFEGPPRYDMPNVPHQGGPPRFDCAPGQQGPPRFAPQHNLQPPMRPMAPPVYDSPVAPQQSFGMAPQRFPEPVNPQFPGGSMVFPAQPAGGFSMQPVAFSQTGPFYSPTAPAVGLQQPVNMMGNMNQPFLAQNPVPFGPQTPQVAPQENHFGQVDVNDLLSKLISNGIIKPSQPDAAAQASATEPSSAPAPAAPPVEEEEEEEQEAEEEDDIPDLTSFSIEHMKQRYESVLTKLYSGNQCCLCSMRFTTAQTDMYADHLDWHFRQNHAGKVASKKVTHRRWYYTLTDWIEFEEIADLEERAKSQFFEKENEEEVQKSQAAAKEKEFQSVRATKDQVGELCEICQEPFETYWVEEEEDWFLKNAIRVDDKNFHPSCFEDYKNTSSYLDVTPSPSKLLTDHPLGAFVKTEEEEGGSACALASVKQEVESEPSELPRVKQEAEQEVLTDPAPPEETA